MSSLHIERNEKNEVVLISITCARCRRDVVIDGEVLKEAVERGFSRKECECGNFFAVRNTGGGFLVRQEETREQLSRRRTFF